MTKIRKCSVAICGLLLFAQLTQANAEQQCDAISDLSYDDQMVFTADSCPELFGDDTDIRINQDYRQRNMRSVKFYEDTIILTHTTKHWEIPSHTNYEDFELIDTLFEPNCAPLAIIELHENEVCEAGLYAVSINHNLSEDGRILSILQDMLLFEMDAQLRFALTPGENLPYWKMVWASPWSIIKPTSGKVTSSKKSRRRSRRRRRRRRRR